MDKAVVSLPVHSARFDQVAVLVPVRSPPLADGGPKLQFSDIFALIPLTSVRQAKSPVPRQVAATSEVAGDSNSVHLLDGSQWNPTLDLIAMLDAIPENTGHLSTVVKRTREWATKRPGFVGAQFFATILLVIMGTAVALHLGANTARGKPAITSRAPGLSAGSRDSERLA